MAVKHFEIHYDKADLDRIMGALTGLQKQLPTHQVAALRRSGDFVKERMKLRAERFKLDGKIVASIGVSPVTLAGVRAVTIGPGQGDGSDPGYAFRQEAGWEGSWPNMTRIAAWAKRRIPTIEPREVFYIARAMAAKGALSKKNPRAGERDGYFYIADTFEKEGEAAQKVMLDMGFEFVDDYFKRAAQA